MQLALFALAICILMTPCQAAVYAGIFGIPAQTVGRRTHSLGQYTVQQAIIATDPSTSSPLQFIRAGAAVVAMDGLVLSCQPEDQATFKCTWMEETKNGVVFVESGIGFWIKNVGESQCVVVVGGKLQLSKGGSCVLFEKR